MGTKVWIISCFLLAVLLIVSDVKARDLDETSSYQQEGKTASEMNKVNDEKYHGGGGWGPGSGYGGPGGGYGGGYGGPGGGYGGGYEGYCRFGCCRRGYYGGCRYCCPPAEAVQRETKAHQPKN